MSEGRVRREPGGGAQVGRHGVQPLGIGFVIGHGLQMARRAAHHGAWSVECRLDLGMLRGIALNLLPFQSVGIQLVAGRHNGLAQEGFVLSQQIVTAAHDAKEPGQRRVLRDAIDRPSAQIALLPIERIHQAAGIGELGYHQLFVRSEASGAIGHGDRLPARGTLRLVVEGTPA